MAVADGRPRAVHLKGSEALVVAVPLDGASRRFEDDVNGDRVVRCVRRMASRTDAKRAPCMCIGAYCRRLHTVAWAAAVPIASKDATMASHCSCVSTAVHREAIRDGTPDTSSFFYPLCTLPLLARRTPSSRAQGDTSLTRVAVLDGRLASEAVGPKDAKQILAEQVPHTMPVRPSGDVAPSARRREPSRKVSCGAA